MYVLRIILMLLGTLPILAALIIGLFIFEDSMVKPRKYASVDKNIAAWNSENWENGDALKVTAQLSAAEGDGDGGETITLLCVTKQFRSGRRSYTRSLSWPKMRSQHAMTLSAPFGDTARLDFVLGDLCVQAAQNHDGWTFPHAIRPKAIWAETVAQGHSFRGSLNSAQIDSMLVEMRPEIVMVETTPLSGIMPQKIYQGLSRY